MERKVFSATVGGEFAGEFAVSMNEKKERGGGVCGGGERGGPCASHGNGLTYTDSRNVLER